jgi:acetyl-CoA C-acetyltransferase
LVTPALAAHGIGAPSTQYALLENARRAAQGRGREEYAAAMGELFAPFTEVAAKNPFSAAPLRRSADEPVAVTERNRMIADPYPCFVVARDQVPMASMMLNTAIGKQQRIDVTAVGDGNRVGMSRGPAARRVSEAQGGVAPAW